MTNFVGVRLWCELWSGKRRVQTNIQERVVFFSNEERMNKHIGRVVTEMRKKGLAFNRKNAFNYYKLVYEVLDEDCVRFITGGKQPQVVA